MVIMMAKKIKPGPPPASRGYGVTTVFTYPKILLTGNIQRNVAATGTAQRNIGVTGDRGANSP